MTQAELPLLVVPLVFPGVPEDEGEELDAEDERNDDETEEGGTEDDGLGEGEGASYMTEELELKVVGGGVPGTGVGWAGGFEMEDEGGSTISELDDPPVMVKVGEMLPEFPITKFNSYITLAGRGRWHHINVDLRAIIYVSPSGYWEGTTMSTSPAVMGKPSARGASRRANQHNAQNERNTTHQSGD